MFYAKGLSIDTLWLKMSPRLYTNIIKKLYYLYKLTYYNNLLVCLPDYIIKLDMKSYTILL